jgi:hypothetical protein
MVVRKAERFNRLDRQDGFSPIAEAAQMAVVFAGRLKK